MAMKKRKPNCLSIATIGYEKASLKDFIGVLQEEGVTLLLDVRELPISRRKGFSKSALSEALLVAGISYQHERRLGSPSQIRNRLRSDGNYVRFFNDFGKYLSSQQEVIAGLAGSLSGTVALMCYERNQEECHRTLVAEALCHLLGNRPKHLKVGTGSLTDGEAKGPSLHTGQGVSAA